MSEIIKNFLGKQCMIYTMTTQLVGTITEIADGWISLDDNGTTNAINIDFIIRIHEYPKKKKSNG